MPVISPLEDYLARVNAGEIQQDPLQNEVVLAFEDLHQNLNKAKKSWLFKSRPPFFGLYIYGSVGRGKTFLMDLFVNSQNKNSIKRLHFHAFMHWFHQQLHAVQGQQDPINSVIKNLALEVNVLCLDEFLVHDITDAMILSRILLTLEKHKISLVTTSNIHPIDLYTGGLQRKKFVPAIAWMQENMRIIQLDGHYDYRVHHPQNNQKWLSPITEDNRNKFENSFNHLIKSEKLHLSPIEINKRRMLVIKRSTYHIMFDFETLCQQARNASDYMQLSHQYQTIFMVINKAIDKEDRNTARRFITLIDVLYDSNTSLYVLSNISFEQLYLGQDLAFEMKRTLSRLTEMQN